MNERPQALAAFVEAAAAAFAEFARDDASRECVARCFAALAVPATAEPMAGQRRAACDHLDAALARPMPSSTLDRLVGTFRAVEPAIVWRPRSDNGTASANFSEGHANAMVFGPGGIEERQDVMLGASLLAPSVRYPDHDHAPEEVYLVMSPGEFRRGTSAWFAPGVGGSFYNEPGIEHAMRSLESPLFAFWVLRTGEPAAPRR